MSVTIIAKNHTHVKKVGQTSEFPFGIYWWTLKNLKNQNFEKMKKNCWRYHHFPHCTKPQSYEVQFLRYRAKQNFFCHFGQFFALLPPSHPPNNPENQNFEKMKKASGGVIILNLCNKNTIIWCMLTQIWSKTDIIFCHFRPFFVLLPHYWHRKLKFGKNVKNTWRYYPYTCVP